MAKTHSNVTTQDTQVYFSETVFNSSKTLNLSPSISSKSKVSTMRTFYSLGTKVLNY